VGGTGDSGLNSESPKDAREERAPLPDPTLENPKKRRAPGRSDHPASPKAASKNLEDVFGCEDLP